MNIIKKSSKQIDWIGINYYFTNFVEKVDEIIDFSVNSTGDKGKSKFNIPGLWKVVFRPDVKTTNWDWTIYPKGLYIVVKWISEKFNCKKPISITENGFGDLEDIKKLLLLKIMKKLIIFKNTLI